ncbi:MAG: hypothetical protein JKX72_01650 [Robiginitomaculum sp.]|nr:hypothetical protein [Robiginitomaculum sp.]
MKTFAYKNTPNVNIMRLHSRAPLVTLADRPIAFTGGCNPRSSVYCRAPHNSFQRVPSNLAYAPTVQRLPRTQPAPQALPYIAPPAPVASYSTHKSYTVNVPNAAPLPSTLPSSNVIGNVVTNQYSYQPAGGGNYWEKASGPTLVGGLPATQIICRRQAPRPAPVTVRVVSPVIGIPVPVPTPVYVPMNTCGPLAHTGFGAPALAGGPSPRANRYGSRWTY